MDMIKQNFEKVVSVAKSDGARVELLIAGGEDLKIGYQKQKINSFESTQSQVAGFRVILGASQGYAYTENLSEESLLRTYKEALNNAKTVKKEGSEVPLVKGAQVATMPELFRPQEVDMQEKMKVAEELEQKCLALDKRVQAVPYSAFNESMSFKRILNSEGLDQEFKQTYFSGYAYPLAKEGEASKMDGEGFFVRSFEEINVEEVATSGVKKATSRLGATKLPTGNYPVVIDREQFSTILQMIHSYFSAKSVDEGKSLFQGKLGEQVASEIFHLTDDPFYATGTGVRPFDDEGAVSQKVVLFENGKLKSFLTNLEYAAKMNLPHTAHASRGPASQMGIAPTNLVVAKGTASLQDLLTRYPGKVVHLTDFTGGLHAGFKESTGDFSMPAEGFLYEDGKCLGPVDQFVMSGNVLSLLKDIVALGNEYGRPGASLISPDVLVKSLSFA